MEVYDRFLVRLDILIPAVFTTTTKVLNDKSLKCLLVKKVVSIGILRPANIPQLITEFVKVVDLGLKRPATLPQVIAEVVDVGKV